MCTPNEIISYKTALPNGQIRAYAFQRLKEYLTSIGNDVNDNEKVHLTQQQFYALTDFTFNEGLNDLKISKLLRH
jgi:GH24 family phage-related lysozyme (muramidase)